MIKQLARKCIFGVRPYIPGKPIDEVKRELGLSSVAKLASNENALGPSPMAVRAARKALTGVHRYPDGASYYLKKDLAKALGLQKDNIAVGNGSDELIVLAARAFLEKNDEVVIAKPTFLIYEIASKIAGAKIRSVPLKDFRYDLKAMKSAVGRKTKMVFIANPDNPTGTFVTKRELKAFFKGLSNNVVVFIDEAYYEFANKNREYPNGLDYVTRPNVIVSRTFSKAYGLSGLRVGYGIGSKEMIGCIERVREPFNVNIVAQAAARAALKDSAFLKKTIAHVRREKEHLYREFSLLGLKYVPSAANFVLINAERPSYHIFEELMKRGYIVRDMGAWGFKTLIRVTVGTKRENRGFIKALREVLGK
ncbi:MAG: histidinol-phosphate transaminase [Candidatus Omnitrophota bacterium]